MSRTDDILSPYSEEKPPVETTPVTNENKPAPANDVNTPASSPGISVPETNANQIPPQENITQNPPQESVSQLPPQENITQNPPQDQSVPQENVIQTIPQEPGTQQQSGNPEQAAVAQPKNEEANPSQSAGESPAANPQSEQKNGFPELSENPNRIDTNYGPFRDYCEHVKCVSMAKSYFTENDNMYITVYDPEKVKKSFFSSSYTQYKLKLKDSKEEPIVRKLDDFNFLHQKLKDLYPGIIIPPTAPSHISLKDDSPKTLNYLTRFINSVCESKILRSTDLVTDFLTMTQENFNKKRKDVYEKETKPKNWSQYRSLDGYLNIYITKNKDEYAQKAGKEVSKLNAIYKKLDDCFDSLIKQFEDISKTVGDLSKIFGELSKAYEGDAICVKGMNWFRDFFNKWSEGYNEQKDFFTLEMKYYFKYMSKEFDLVTPLANEFQALRASYDDKFKKFIKNPIKSAKEEQAVVQAKRGFAYHLAKVEEEYSSLRERHNKRLTKQFIILSEMKDKFENIFI